MKFFNTSGPINPHDHYAIQHRFNEALFHQLIEQKKYFVLHAPRQSGKTTAISNFVNQLNRSGKQEALYINVEPAQAARSDFKKGLRIILDQIRLALELLSENHRALQFFSRSLKVDDFTGNEFSAFLRYWSMGSDKPVLLFIDEIDSLVGDTLISVLRQLRAGYIDRPKAFPQSVCLVGVRDVRDYRIWSDSEQQSILGGSAFNIKAESLTLSDFSFEQVKDLYEQHTQETKQKFTDDAIKYAFEETQGQPWLVNALAYQACFRDVTDYNVPITKEILERAREALIKRQDTHIDVLIDRLQEPRVKNIMDAIISGQSDMKTFPHDDVQYMRDLGLIKPHDFEIANPIYQEIIPRALAHVTQERVREKTVFYQNEDGSLNMKKLLTKFTEFYRENSSTWLADFQYKESGPHILLMAFMQRVINGGGTIYREYALDRKRVDLLISWRVQRIVVELKVKRSPKAKDEGVLQTAEYMDIANATEGHLVIFDRDLEKRWDEKIYHEQKLIGSKTIEIWGM